MNNRAESAHRKAANGQPSTVNLLRFARWAALGGAVLLAFALVGACGGDGALSPQEVATKWRLAFKKGDFGTAWDLRDPKQRGGKGRAAYIASSRESRKTAPITPDHEVTDIEVTKTVEDNTQKEDFVFVYLRVTTRDYGSDEEIVTLRQVDGDWRVAKWEP